MSPSKPVLNLETADDRKRVLAIVFLIVFLDMAGFSIIFPLFPSMLDYYIEREGSSGFLGSVVGTLDQFRVWLGAREDQGHDILFGGFLSAVYALLQFLCAPVFGVISDKIGRRPVLLFAITGLAISYGMWFFAGTFAILVAARLVGGLMSGNISTASAVVADITQTQDRSRGMAVLGAAIGVSFMCGPALGGLASLLDLTKYWATLADWGINPYSTAALVALLLAVTNWMIVAFYLPETRPLNSGSGGPRRSANPLTLFRREAHAGVTHANITYFLFLLAFSGMVEFAITFLVKDRFNYHPGQIALMFLFVGVILTVAQGSYVRKWSGVIGPRRMTVHGLLCIIPGMALIGFSDTLAPFYTGLVLTSVGSAQVRPCMSALVSLYTPSDDQGRILGVFRSLEGLTRAISPILACLLYWNLGARMAYAVAAAVTLLPLALAMRLPQPATNIK